MAHSISAKKRIRQNLKRRGLNRWRKGQIKDQVGDLLNSIQAGDAAKAKESFRKATKILDQVASKGAIHPNTAARRKSRLARRLNQIQGAKKTA